MSALDDHIKNASHKRWGTVALLSIFSLVSVSMLVLIVLSLIVPPALEKMVDTYTEPEPMLLPAIVFSESEKAEVEARLEDFELGLEHGERVAPLDLTEIELNGLIGDNDAEVRTHLTIEDGIVRAQMSLLLETDLEIGPWRSSMHGRYINGIADIRIGIDDDILTADLVSFTVKGERVPSWLRSILQREIDSMEWLRSQDVRNIVGKLDRVEFQDGHIVLYPEHGAQ